RVEVRGGNAGSAGGERGALEASRVPPLEPPLLVNELEDRSPFGHGPQCGPSRAGRPGFSVFSTPRARPCARKALVPPWRHRTRLGALATRGLTRCARLDHPSSWTSRSVPRSADPL